MKYKAILYGMSVAGAIWLLPSTASAHPTWSVTVGSDYSYPGDGDDGYSNYDRHVDEHEQLAQEHAAAHDQLDEQHAEAHEQGLSPWEHAQLHRQLRYQHELNDYEIAREHQRQHDRDYEQSYAGYGDDEYDGY